MADSHNSLSTMSYRKKWFSTTTQELLRVALVAEKVCNVDNSDLYTIENPYGSDPTATVSAITGTYTIGDWTTTNDTLTVTEEVKIANHVYDFEKVLARYDMYKERMKVMMFSVARAIDIYVLNNLLEDGTGTYSTPAGGFTTASNINEILANLLSKVAGYENAGNGYFLVLENTDLTGLIQAQMTNGYSFADSALNNGLLTRQAGIDIYVVRTGTFTNETATSVSGTKTWTNSGHRVFGIKNAATYASPRGIQYTEKEVSGRTGAEIVAWGYIGFKLWNQKAALVVDITIT